jgi:hypothetical protein
VTKHVYLPYLEGHGCGDVVEGVDGVEGGVGGVANDSGMQVVEAEWGERK